MEYNKWSKKMESNFILFWYTWNKGKYIDYSIYVIFEVIGAHAILWNLDPNF